MYLIKNNKFTNIMRYYYNLKQLFSFWI